MSVHAEWKIRSCTLAPPTAKLFSFCLIQSFRGSSLTLTHSLSHSHLGISESGLQAVPRPLSAVVGLQLPLNIFHPGQRQLQVLLELLQHGDWDWKCNWETHALYNQNHRTDICFIYTFAYFWKVEIEFGLFLLMIFYEALSYFLFPSFVTVSV